MQEYSTTVRGSIHNIDKPFFVLATQNPLELEGTYPLPEAQLDRFLFNILLDYLSTRYWRSSNWFDRFRFRMLYRNMLLIWCAQRDRLKSVRQNKSENTYALVPVFAPPCLSRCQPRLVR